MSEVETREFKAEVTAEELKTIRKAKVDIGAESNKEFVFKLIDHYNRTKGREIL